MKVMTIRVDEETVSLRLTASKLAQYAVESGTGGNTLFAVMDALDDVFKQGALLTAALTYKGNANTVKDGFDLMDMLADAGYTPAQAKELILDLAVDSGVIGKEDAAALGEAIREGSRKLCAAAVAVLSGNIPDIPAVGQTAQETAENPT